MTMLIAVGWIAIMLLIGVILKGLSKFLRNMLVPASVIGGILGLIIANTIGFWGGESGGEIARIESSTFSTIVTHLFTLSFISIGLVGIKKGGGKGGGSTGKSIFRGTMGMGIVWVILYTLTAALGAAILLGLNGVFDFSPLYGLLVPFAFCQGPGQAATFGAIFESYGIPDAVNVGVTFAAIGFIVAFAVGVPLAKAGIRKGYAKHLTETGKAKIPVEEEGALDMPAASDEEPAEEQGAGTMEALTFSFILIGLTYVITYFLTALIVYLVPSLGDTLWGLMFMTGMVVGYGVKAILNKTKISRFHDTTVQQKISNWMTDFLVAAAFMAVSVSAIKDYAIPILLVSVAASVVTYFACVYFGHRFGDENDFERTLGLWGTATGTVPCGVALARIVDPETRTTTNIELGLMNLPMFFSTPSLLIMLATAAGQINITLAIGLLLIPIPILLILLKVFRAWGKKNY